MHHYRVAEYIEGNKTAKVIGRGPKYHPMQIKLFVRAAAAAPIRIRFQIGSNFFVRGSK